MDYLNMYQNEYLAHYGVPGMKWGVRKYRNFEGTYTKAGVKRFDESMQKYNHAKQKYRDAKKNKLDDGTITNARIAKQAAKRKLNRDYKQLKYDKLGDKGKELYSKGARIRINNNVTRALDTAGKVSLGAIAYAAKNGMLQNKKVKNGLIIAASGTITLANAKHLVDWNQNRKLRAYYSHSAKK